VFLGHITLIIGKNTNPHYFINNKGMGGTLYRKFDEREKIAHVITLAEPYFSASCRLARSLLYF
jgi:hypothetical protein